MYGYNPFNAMGDNPISYSDQNGDFIPGLIIASALTGGFFGALKAVKNNSSVWTGFFKGAVVGGIGGTLGQIGGGSLINEIVSGAIEGGLTGGISAELNGGNFMDGALRGGLSGIAFSFGVNLPQAIRNAKQGCGFNTNMGTFERLAEEAIEGGIVNEAKAVDVLQYWMSRYGGPRLYRPIKILRNVSPFTDPYTGKIYMTDPAFLSGPDALVNTIVHESAHYYKSIDWLNGIGSTGSGTMHTEGLGIIPDHGTIGYYDAIRQSGKYSVSIRTLKGFANNGFFYPLANQAWKSYGITKYWHAIPTRF